ncbi:hypothetical protein ABPG75_000011 [Micractinium tetrahymenae]
MTSSTAPLTDPRPRACLQRPANALKEMLENSLDAGATQIIVTVKDGGKALLQIQDNGHGIRKEDLPVLCERHTTSKLRSFEDLEGIQTLGFRGEALASISHVANLTVTTMTAGQPHGWRVAYSDGIMDLAGPKPAAANRGTLISVECLFANIPLRRKALKSAAEENRCLLEIMGAYAVYKAGVSMTCKRQGEARSDLHTLAGASRLDNIRAVFGAAVSKHVLPLELTCGDGAAGAGPGEAADAGVHCEVEGYISNADFSGKRTQMVLFINGRSVECTALKRALEATYAAVLPKAAKPFIFLEVRLPGSHVDVNVHPTKKEVGFLHQEELIEAVRAAVEEKLLSTNSKRMYAQMLLPGAPLAGGPADAEAQPAYHRPDKLVRTDHKAQTLHAFLGSGGTSGATHQQVAMAAPEARMEQQRGAIGAAHGEAPCAAEGMQDGVTPEQVHTVEPATAAAVAAAMDAPTGRRRISATVNSSTGGFELMPTPMEIAGATRAGLPLPASEHQRQAQFRAPLRQQRDAGSSSNLAAVHALLTEAESRPHAGLYTILRSYTFVGMAHAGLAFVQHGTRLYLLDVQRLSADMFYQQVLRRFGTFRRIQIRPPLLLEGLVLAALEAQEVLGRWHDATETGTKHEVAGLLLQLLRQKAGMLSEYFSIDITEDGCLASLPQLIEQYVPRMDRLPAFVLALGQDVEWTEEKACFQGLAQALAELYCVQPTIAEAVAEARGREDDICVEGDCAAQCKHSTPTGEQRQQEWTLQHVLLPALRLFLVPSRQRASDGSVVELTRLETLYRIFERC